MKTKLIYIAVIYLFFCVESMILPYDNYSNCKTQPHNFLQTNNREAFFIYDSIPKNRWEFSGQFQNNEQIEFKKEIYKINKNKKSIDSLREEIALQKEEIQKLQIQIFALSELTYTEEEGNENLISIDKSVLYVSIATVVVTFFVLLVWNIYLQKFLLKARR